MHKNLQSTDITQMTDVKEQLTINDENMDNEEVEGAFSVECQDHREFCPDNFTCCRTPNSGYACCKFREVGSKIRT